MFLTCLTLFTFLPFSTAKPLYVEVVFFEQQAASQQPASASPGSIPSDAMILATIAAKVELGKHFTARTHVGDRYFEVAGTVQLKEAQKQLYHGNVQLSAYRPYVLGRDSWVMDARFEQKPDEQLIVSGSMATSAARQHGFLGLSARRKETVRLGYALRVTENPSVGVVPAGSPHK
jgi:hypothetical protein